MKLTNKGKAVLGFGLTALITGISTFCLVWLMSQHPNYTPIFLGMAVITTIIFITTWAMMWLCLFTNLATDEPAMEPVELDGVTYEEFIDTDWSFEDDMRAERARKESIVHDGYDF